MRKNIKHKKIIILTILIIALTTPIVYGKYFSIDKLTGQIEIANPIFIVEGAEATKISEINSIGYYEFSIKNFEGNNISETGFIYTIEIISKVNGTIEFELYNSEEEIITLHNLKTKEKYIKGNEKQEHKYKLKVMYNSTKGNKGEDILEEVQIKVHSEQETR